MKKILNKILVIGGLSLVLTGCKRSLDVNESPNNLTQAPLQTVLTNITTNVGFLGGSDMHRFTSLWAQQFAGQGAGGTQTLEYERYNLQSSDVNNLWSTCYSTILMDCEYVIANGSSSPWYTGIAKIVKAWTYQNLVDLWGDVPFSEATLGTANRIPKYDDDAAIYPQLITLIDQGIAELNATTSALNPGSNETIYGGNRARWIRFANTLKLRIFLHYSEIDAARAKAGIDALVNANATFISSNAESFQMFFVDAANAQNPIHQFEPRRLDQFFPNRFLVNMMNTKVDPRRPFYFTPFPYTATPGPTSTYVGVTPGDPQSINYSRMHTYLRGALKVPALASNAAGAVTSVAANHTAYTGAAPIRILTFAEYNFIRAEAALRFGSPGSAQSFFEAGIRASMQDAGVAAADVNSYVAANGTLTGTNAQQLRQIIEEKYVALYGVAVEPWSDWRRTGFPLLSAVPNAMIPGGVPTIFWYPQSEINSNPNCKQKANLFQRVFWDN